DPDWRILSAQGAVLDQMGRCEEARQYYASALKIRPDEPSVLSNLGLSYLLSKDLAHAEEALRRAHSQDDKDPRVRMNLAVVLALEGKQAEAEGIVKARLPLLAVILRVNLLATCLIGASSELLDLLTSPWPVNLRAISRNIWLVRWFAESSAIICPLLAAVPNRRESNGMTATGWLSSVLAKLRRSISGRLGMPTWLRQNSGIWSLGRDAFSTLSMFLALRRLARSGSATIKMSSAPSSARLVHAVH